MFCSIQCGSLHLCCNQWRNQDESIHLFEKYFKEIWHEELQIQNNSMWIILQGWSKQWCDQQEEILENGGNFSSFDDLYSTKFELCFDKIVAPFI